MRILIVYSTKYGATEKAAENLAENIEGDIDLVNLKKNNVKNLDNYDAVAVGGSIYMGQIQDEVKEFCKVKKTDLLEKNLGLFICCGRAEQAMKQLNDSYEEKLLNQAKAKGYFGYEYNLEKMNFFYRIIVKILAKINENKYKINVDNIKDFTDNFVK